MILTLQSGPQVVRGWRRQRLLTAPGHSLQSLLLHMRLVRARGAVWRMASTFNSSFYFFMHAQAGMGLRSCPVVYTAIL